MTIKQIEQWFEAAIPNPDDINKFVQFGVMLEEVAEALEAVHDYEAGEQLGGIADSYKEAMNWAMSDGITFTADREKLLDALCDIIVTVVGVSRQHGLDLEGALAEVNRSNWSKFENGRPVFKMNGKIGKGEHYTPPDLTPYL